MTSTIDYKLIWAIVVSIVTACAAIASWLALRSRKEGASDEVTKQLADRLNKVETKGSKHDGELQAMSVQMAGLPTRQELQSLSNDINNVRAALGQISGQLTGVARAVDLMNQHLIREGQA